MALDFPVVVLYSKTATADTLFKLVGCDQWLEYADVFVTTNSAYLSDMTGNKTVPIYANDIYTFPFPVNVFDMCFKNYTAGSNCVVTIIGTTLTKKKANEYGIVLPS